ncbi:MAG: hypothetical protein WBQ36_04785 [Desulfobaccales bacterium]
MSATILIHKKTLDPQLFIFLAATEKEFRYKYFFNPAALADDFDISEENFAILQKIDFAALSKDLNDLEEGIIRKPLISAADTCHDNGHSSSLGSGHSNSTHSNTCPKAQVMMLTEEVGKVIKKSC